MDFVTIVLATAALVGGLLSKLVVSEVQDWIPTFARRIVDLAAQRLPADQQERYREEFCAHLEEYPGRLAKLYQAAAIYLRARDLKNALPAAKPQSTIRSVANADSYVEEDTAHLVTETRIGLFDFARVYRDSIETVRLLSNLTRYANDPDVAKLLRQIDSFVSDGTQFYNCSILIEKLNQYRNLAAPNIHGHEENDVRSAVKKLLEN